MVVVKRPANPDYGPEIEQGEKVKLPETNARQGVTHHNVRYVLAISLGVVIIGMVLAYFVFFPR
jgi:uncharacterized membrane protein SpoIIM required for sporulation